VSAKKPRPKVEHRWRIIRLKSTPAAHLGTVTAPDKRSAIDRAATEFQVPIWLRRNLMVHRVK
jgi:hypothetical protein